MKVSVIYILLLSFYSIVSFGQTESVSHLVSEIAKAGSLGFDQDQQYFRFLRLCELADSERLVALMDHNSPAVRGYSFWALAKRDYPDLKSIFIDHIDDHAKVLQKNGCMVGDESVISFMKQVVTPYMYDPDCMKLDDSTRALVK